jgi:ABC-type transport system involved in multi-copper enzyme maturation permease subunit
LTTARRGRFYFGRAAYAGILLLIFWAIYADWTTRADLDATINQMSWLAAICFCSIAVAQVVLVLCLTPALVAGVIADEKQRKTLHYLMASRLTGPEIVVGKLLARMLHVAVLVAVGFPVLNLLVLLGGIDPLLILLACGVAASTAWFLAALAIWVSTIARKARDALFVTYGLEFLWLFVPTLIGSPPSTGWPALDAGIDRVLDVWVACSPGAHATRLLFGALTGGPNLTVQELILMIEYQVIAGLVLTLLAAWQLRPVFRAQEGGRSGRRWLSRRRSVRLWSRPALGNRPMLWKELFTSRARGFVRLVGFLVTLVAGGFLLYYTVWFGGLALLERWDQGRDAPTAMWYQGMNRYQFFWFLKSVVPLVYIAGLLSVAGAAAASVTSEHEQDTWTSLTSTDLTGREIILSKLLGALWRPRMIVAVILLMALAGAVAGSISFWSLLPLCIALLIYGWFAAALGVWISLHLRSTWRAQFLTTSGLLLISLLGQAILSNLRRYAPLLWPGFTPYEISKTLLSPSIRVEWEYQVKSWSLAVPALDDGPVWMLIFWLVNIACYLAGAIGLTLLSVRQFDAVAGRARRRREAPASGPVLATVT